MIRIGITYAINTGFIWKMKPTSNRINTTTVQLRCHTPLSGKRHTVARVMEMVHANVNNPSIVIWSLGNEAGPGKNFVAAYDALKAFDTSRPVQYERNNDIVDDGF